MFNQTNWICYRYILSRRKSRVLGGTAYAVLSPKMDRLDVKLAAKDEASAVYAQSRKITTSFGPQASAKFRNSTSTSFGSGCDKDDMITKEMVREMNRRDYLDKTNGPLDGRGPGAYDSECDYTQFVDEHIAQFGAYVVSRRRCSFVDECLLLIGVLLFTVVFSCSLTRCFSL